MAPKWIVALALASLAACATGARLLAPPGMQSLNPRMVLLPGTYDPDTGTYVLQWASQVEGGPFNGFTGIWHLEGTLEG